MPIPGAAFGGAGRGVITPMPPSSWSEAYGGIPSVPSPGATAGTAVGANIGNLSNILNLGQGVQRFTDQAVLDQLRRGLPNYEALTAASSANILSELAGEVPGDVVNQILQRAAERGIITGTVGSENANAAMLRALGLTSLDLTQRGEQNLTAAIGRTPRGPMFNPATMFVNPADVQEAQMAANLYASAPNPMAAGTRALGAAMAGANAGARIAPSWSQRNAMNEPSWSGVTQTPQTAAWADYGPTQAYSNPSLQNEPPPVDPYQDWMTRTFGPNPAFGGVPGGGSYYSNQRVYGPNFIPSEDPLAPGYWDATTGDFYSDEG